MTVKHVKTKKVGNGQGQEDEEADDFSKQVNEV